MQWNTHIQTSAKKQKPLKNTTSIQDEKRLMGIRGKSFGDGSAADGPRMCGRRLSIGRNLLIQMKCSFLKWAFIDCHRTRADMSETLSECVMRCCMTAALQSQRPHCQAWRQDTWIPSSSNPRANRDNKRMCEMFLVTHLDLQPQLSFLLKLSGFQTWNCSPLAVLWAFLVTRTVKMHCQYWGMELTSNLTMSGLRKACHLMQLKVRLAGLCFSHDRPGGRSYIKRSGRLTQDGISQILTALLLPLHDYNQSNYWFHVHAGGGEDLR